MGGACCQRRKTRFFRAKFAVCSLIPDPSPYTFRLYYCKALFFGFGHFQPSAPFCALAVRRLHALKLAGTRFAILWIGLTQDHIGPCIRLTDISDQEWRSVTVVRFGRTVSVYHQTVKSTQVIALAFHWGTCTDPL